MLAGDVLAFKRVSVSERERSEKARDFSTFRQAVMLRIVIPYPFWFFFLKTKFITFYFKSVSIF